MSFRRPKAKVIQNDSSDEGEVANNGKKPTGKTQRRKMKPKIKMDIGEMENDQSAPFDNITTQSGKKPRMKNHLKLPSFEGFGDANEDLDDYSGAIAKENDILKHFTKVDEDDVNIIHKSFSRAETPQSNIEEIINQEELENLKQSDEFRRKNDFISIEDPDRDYNEESELREISLGSNEKSEHEAEIDIQDQEIKDKRGVAFGEYDYLSDLNSDDDDWVSSKLKSGSIMNKPKEKRTILPKLNLVGDVSLEDESKRLKQIIDDLKIKKIEISHQLEIIDAEREANDTSKIEWEKRLSELADSLEERSRT